MSASFRVAGLFAGIGGIELGFRNALGSALETTLLCESWEPAKKVLAAKFPGVDLHDDVATLHGIPQNLDLVAAGFPCADLSQAGGAAGIRGEQSGLVAHLFEMLARAEQQNHKLPWLLIENVPNMLALDRGEAMAYLVKELEALGYSWAYRVVDSRFTGVPQRRRRVIMLASRTEDPAPVLFPDVGVELDINSLRSDAFGFYWTEGRGGLGWAQDATPTFKGGSGLGIPSTPAVWLPDRSAGERIVVPSIEDVEALQGFERGWTAAADVGRRNGPRWKLVGNAVTVGVAEWVARRIMSHGSFDLPSSEWQRYRAWPLAAWGSSGNVWTVSATEFPELQPYSHLRDLLALAEATILSHRATSGFWKRLQSGSLGQYPGFREAIEEHIAAVDSREELPAPVVVG